jgi:hypothetical protein
LIEVSIPPAKLATVRSPECEAWILEHCAGSVIGRGAGEAFALLFSDEGEAAAFVARWFLGGGSHGEKEVQGKRRR